MTTEAGQRLLDRTAPLAKDDAPEAVKRAHVGRREVTARMVTAIEAEAREQAWAEISTRYVTHAEEAQRRVEAVVETRREALREAREAVAAVGGEDDGNPFDGTRVVIGRDDALAAIDALMGGSPEDDEGREANIYQAAMGGPDFT